MRLGLLIPHFERPEALARCLASVEKATTASAMKTAKLVLDDSAPEVQSTVRRLVLETPGCFMMRFEYLDGKPQWAKKFNDGKGFLDGLDVDTIGIVSADTVVAPDFFVEALAALARHPKGLIVAPGLNRSAEKAITRGGLVNAMTGDKLLTNHEWADNGMLYFLRAEDWQPWDEAADEFGFGHAVPEWLFRLRQRVEFWRVDRLVEHQIDHAAHTNAYAKWKDRARESTDWYYGKIGGPPLP